VSDGVLLGAVALEGKGSRNEKLLPAVDWLLSESGIDRSSLDLLAVTRGPGSFTGVRIGLGTDTYPLDIVSEMRYASLISRLVDRKASGARAAAVFNAATIGGADALGRPDLGRLAVGAKADMVILNLRTTRYGPMRDPINALVEYGSGADVETVMVDGEVVVENGRSTRIDDDELFAQAEAGAKRAWDAWSTRDWNGRSVEQIIPPAFPTRKN